MINFASDNCSGVHPQILEALEEANHNAAIAYGDDIYTEKAIKKFKPIFGDNIEVYFVYNGTAANTLAISGITNSYHAIACAETSHLNEDECGAPEKFSGCKLITLPSKDGKITIDQIEKYLFDLDFEHRSQLKVISITQPTEFGVLYSNEEVKTLADFVHKNKLYLHMDGARIANAAAALQQDFKSITRDLGVDVLSFGATKNGLMFGEAVVFFNPNLCPHFKYVRKQGMQLHSKMRYISAQFDAYLTNDLWLKNAQKANDMTRLFHSKIKDISQLSVTQKVDANAIFATLPKKIIEKLQEEFLFYLWNPLMDEVRWMTSFNTTKEEVSLFYERIKTSV